MVGGGEGEKIRNGLGTKEVKIFLISPFLFYIQQFD